LLSGIGAIAFSSSACGLYVQKAIKTFY